MIRLDTASDAVLVVGVGRWSQAALAEIYRRHGGAVHALVRQVLGADSLADDVTQDVFVNLWKRPEQFDSNRGTLRTFLLTTAHGRAIDLKRSEAARSARERRSARQTATAGYDIERHALDLVIAEQLREAIGTLPDGERRAIELAYYDGQTYREVALSLGQPEGTVKSRIRSGLRRLHGAMSQHEGETWTES